MADIRRHLARWATLLVLHRRERCPSRGCLAYHEPPARPRSASPFAFRCRVYFPDPLGLDQILHVTKDELNPKYGSFALAFVLNKLFEVVRIPLAMAVTVFVRRLLNKRALGEDVGTQPGSDVSEEEKHNSSKQADSAMGLK